MLDVLQSRELQAVVLTLTAADRVIRNDLNKKARQGIRPVWRSELDSRAATRLENRVILPGATVSPSARGMTLRAATSRKALSGGLVPSYEWQGVELGMTPKRRTYQTRSRKGNRYTVTRLVGTGLPARKGRGRMAFPAASDTGTKLVGMWVQTVVEALAASPDMDVTS